MEKALFKRTLSLFLTFTLLLGVAVGITASADEKDYIGAYPKEITEGADLRIMTYNLLADNAEGGFDWGTPLGNRAETAIDCMRYYLPDVIGIQEATRSWYTAIKARCIATYAFVNHVYDKVDYNTVSGLMYNRRTVKLLGSELISYSEGNCPRARVINMGYFQHISTGEKFIVVCTHFNAGNGPDIPVRELQASELAAKLNEYAETYKCPVISVADYNSKKGSVPQTTITETASMLYSDIDPENTIDHILYRGAVTPKYSAIVKDEWVKNASDHQPVFTDFCLDNKPIKGDMDEDGEVTVTDALIALRIAAKLATATERDMLLGNLDGDRKITVSDALIILRKAAKLED